jgi:hypothetical protein
MGRGLGKGFPQSVHRRSGVSSSLQETHIDSDPLTTSVARAKLGAHTFYNSNWDNGCNSARISRDQPGLGNAGYLVCHKRI